MEAMHWSNY